MTDGVTAVTSIALLLLVPLAVARADSPAPGPSPTGPAKLDALWAQHNPWEEFDDDDSVLTVTRVEKVDTPDCGRWLSAVAQTLPGDPIPTATPDPWATAWRTWAPWSKSDLEAVKGCDSYPCAVKLSEPETQAMKAAPEDDRMAHFQQLVLERVKRFQAGSPEPYEFSGKPADPWSVFDKAGDLSGLPRPAQPQLRSSRLNLDPDRMKTLHQILDVRTTASKAEATVWDRAAYSDHYFDAWGEWRDLRCRPGGVVVSLVLVVDFDLLKKGDLISLLAHGRMRKVIDENGRRYLASVFAEIQRVAGVIR